MSQFKLADNVKETTTTTGTGPVSLAGAFASSFKTFVNGIGSTYLTAYKIDDGAGNWECRYGVIASGTPDTITNAGFISSSSGSAVSFGSGTKTVTCVPMPELVITAAISPVLAETDIASATTTDLGSVQTLRVRITGTTTITGFGTSPNTLRFVRFAGALTLTYNATSLILKGAVNRVTITDAIGLYISDGSGNWRELFYADQDTSSSGFPSFKGIVGTTTNDNANAGCIGQEVRAEVLSGSPVSLTSSTSTNVTSISLTAGDWEVWFEGGFTGSATSVGRFFLSTSTTSATIAAGREFLCTLSGNNSNWLAVANLEGVSGPARFSLASTTTIYAVVNAGFSGGTGSAYGLLKARRVR